MLVLLASMGYCGITNKKGNCVLCLLVLSLFISYFFVAWNHSGNDMTQPSFTSSKFGMAKLVIDRYVQSSSKHNVVVSVFYFCNKYHK